MKRNNILRLAGMLLVWGFAVTGASCKKDTVDNTYLDVSGDIVVTKKGFSYNGDRATVSVGSNTYWVLSYDDAAGWLTPSVKAGSGDRDVELTIAENDLEEMREATLTFKTKDGLARSVKVTQMGRGEVLTYISAGFGQEASGESVNQYEDWDTSGTGAARTLYGGTNAFVDKSSPSSGYEGASGGNNIVLSADGSVFQFGGVVIGGGNSFILSFASSTSGSAFDTDELKLFISKDQSNWTPIPYTRSAGSGWEMSLVPFVLVRSGIDQVYFRFEASSGESYRIDDFSLIEGTGSGTDITFVEDLINTIDYLIFEEHFDWVDGQKDADNTSYEEHKFGGNDDGAVAAQNGWTFSTVYKRWHMVKGGHSTGAGVATTRALSELTGTTTLLLQFDIAAAYGADYKSMKVEVLNAGTIYGEKTVTFSVDQVQQWYTQTFVIDGANATTQISIKSALESAEIAAAGTPNRFILDNVLIYKRVEENPSTAVSVTLTPDMLEFGKGEETLVSRMDINKEWTVEAGDWLTVSPESGSYGTADLSITAAQNDDGAPRTGSVKILVDGEEAAVITVEQSDKFNATVRPQPTGLTILQASTGTVTFEWDTMDDVPRMFIAEVAATADGPAIQSYEFYPEVFENSSAYEQIKAGAVAKFPLNRFTIAGLTAATDYYVRVKTVGEADKVEDSPWTSLSFSTAAQPILDEDVVLFNNFDGCAWGGDNILKSWGYRPKNVGTSTPASASKDDPCHPETGGSGNMMGITDTEYKSSRGITGWTSTALYEFPGYIKFGTSTAGGTMTTAALSNIEGTVDLEVYFKLGTYNSTATSGTTTVDTFNMTVEPVDAGTVSGNNEFTLTGEFKWQDGFKATINGATSATKLKFTTAKTAGGTNGARCMLDDIKVVKVDNTTLSVDNDTPSLPAEGTPAAAVNVTSTAPWTASSDATWLAFTDSGAAGPNVPMSITADPNESNGSRSGVITISAGGKVRATLTVTQAAAATASKAAIPGNLRLLEATTTNVSFTWDNVSGNDRKFRIQVASAPEGETLTLFGQTASFEPNIQSYNQTRYPNNGFTMSRLEPDTEYYIRVQTISTQSGLGDSDFAVMKVRTAPQPVLPSNCVYFHNFDQCMWGGCMVNKAFGYAPLSSGDQSGYDAYTAIDVLRGPEDGGSSNIIGSGTNLGNDYRISRNFVGWTSTTVYEFPGYIKFGSGSAGGTFTTAALSNVSGTNATLEVSFKLAAWVQTSNDGVKTTDKFTLTVTASNGTVTGTNTFTVTDTYVWKDGFKVTITGASAETKLTFTTSKVTDGTNGARALFDDLMVIQR